MLAGLPKAPSAYNPIVNPSRARIRQEYVLRRMHSLDFLDDKQLEEALQTELVYRNRKANGDDVEATTGLTINADYAAEMARQAVVEMYGEEAYIRHHRHHHPDRQGTTRRPARLAQHRYGL